MVQKYYNYNDFKYDNIERWCSYWHQIYEVMKLNPKNLLEIGGGNGTVNSYIKNKGVSVTSLDISQDNKPDILASVESMPIEDNSFDVVLCAEVLEHLPFEKFGICLNEIHRVARKYAIISLPHWGRHFSVEIKIPYFKKFRKNIKLNIFKEEHMFNGYHYWEIGKKNYSLRKIKKSICSPKFKILIDYCVFEMPYHHFFTLEKI